MFFFWTQTQCFLRDESRFEFHLMFSEQVKVEQTELPGRVDDVTLFVLLRVKQHDDTPETQTQSASFK